MPSLLCDFKPLKYWLSYFWGIENLQAFKHIHQDHILFLKKLKNHMEKGTCWPTVNWVVKSQMRLKRLSTDPHIVGLQYCVSFSC